MRIGDERQIKFDFNLKKCFYRHVKNSVQTVQIPNRVTSLVLNNYRLSYFHGVQKSEIRPELQRDVLLKWGKLSYKPLRMEKYLHSLNLYRIERFCLTMLSNEI